MIRHRNPARKQPSSHQVNPVEQLEQRVLLAGDYPLPGPGGQPLSSPGVLLWNGFQSQVRNGVWVLSFDQPLGAALAVEGVRQAAARLGVPVDGVRSIGSGRWAVLESRIGFTEADVRRVTAQVPHLTSIEPDRLYFPSTFPNDPQFNSQWWLSNTGQLGGVPGADIHASEAWDITIGSQSVIVAVIDSGVQLDHPDLTANIWRNPGETPGNAIDDDGNGFVDDVNGWDFGDLDNNPDDNAAPPWYGHGTSCAGMIGAVGDNGIGVSGVAWNVSIIPMKIANRYGIATTAAIVGAHDYLTMMRQQGHNIVASNNSYGAADSTIYKDAPAGFSAEKDAITRFIASGGTFVASAANGGDDGIGDNNDDPSVTNYPSSYNIPGLISVAATDAADSITGFSNYGPETVDIGAPGQATWTTNINSGYRYFGGTSAAGPVIVGVVALLKSYKANASAVEVRQALLDSADPLPSLQGKIVSGGRVNAARALQIIGLEGPILRAVSPGPVTSQTDVNTGQVIRSVSMTFNKDIDPVALASAGVGAIEVRRAGTDGSLGTGDDQLMSVSSVVISPTDPRTVVATLNLVGNPLQRLPLDKYRLTLVATAFKDTNGNLLNGNSGSGADQTYLFEVVAVTAGNETNDTTLTATQTTFATSGTAIFSSAVIGNGLAGALDVDIYRIDIARGALITAEIKAKRLPVPSPLDSVLRLFNASGNQIAINDQFYWADSYIDFFVTTGGTYYIAVSGFGNSTYDPFLTSSGKTQSTGTYNLTIGVQMTDEDHIVGASTLTTPKRTPATGTQGTITDTITVSDSRQILDLNLRLTATHEFRSDLIISLTSPAGTTFIMVNRRGGSGQDFGDPNQGTSLFLDDDEATTPISALSSAQPGSGAFRPDNPLSGFDGQSALGVWTIVFNDTTALNSGFLYSWSLELTLSNNIFGPFESNDTLVTARNLTQISTTGSGTTTRDAKVGDGGFGVFDRDIFRFTVAAGATLNAVVTPTAVAGSPPGTLPSLNSALRLFDESGHEIILSNLTDTQNSNIENLVFRDAGVYYLAVSEGANTTYDPFNPISGVPSATTGDYTLTVSVAAGVSDGAHALTGTTLNAGFNPSGALLSSPGVIPGSGSGRVGLRWNNTEFLFYENAPSALPRSFFGASAGGIGFVNQNSVANNAPVVETGLPLAIVNQSDAFNRRTVATGLFGDLRVERSLSFGINDSFAAFDVVLTNLGGTPLSSVSWMEGFNPDPGLNLFPQTSATRNDTDNTFPLATASFVNNEFPLGLTVALGAPASQPGARATILSNLVTLRDSGQLLALSADDPNGAASDGNLALSFDLGDLGVAGTPTASVHVRYFVFFGNTPAEARAMYLTLNAGTGTGHLAADPANPASESILQPDDETTTSIPTLPYRVYYPEGFANFSTYTFVPILNPSEQSNRVVVIARYEMNPLDPTALRDHVIADFVIAPASRSGITITDPTLYANDTLLVRKDVPYALEIRSQTPVAATFSHYDTFLLAGGRAAIGEAFTTRVSPDWTFSQVTKSPDTFSGTSDFVLFMNTSGLTIKVDTTFYPRAGGSSITLTQTLEPYRRGGWNINDLPQLASGAYGVILNAEGPIVAALSHYDLDTASAAGMTGSPTAGSVSGVIPEGQLGLGSTSELIGIINPNAAPAAVTFSFLLSGGSTYRHVINVEGRTNTVLDVGSLLQFPAGQSYSILYTSTVPISLAMVSLADGEGLGTGFSDRAYTYWGFGEGFRPPSAPDGYNNVSESLNLFNPSSSDVLAEITIRFDNDLGQETFRQVVPARRALNINVADLITGNRRDLFAFYGITVKTASPIVAGMEHYDRFFPGAFSTLGTPLGLSLAVS